VGGLVYSLWVSGLIKRPPFVYGDSILSIAAFWMKNEIWGETPGFRGELTRTQKSSPAIKAEEPERDFSFIRP
jgi:hypothetical protein